MEPRHPGGLSSLRQRRRNPLALSLRVGSCGRSVPRSPRNSLGGRSARGYLASAGGPGHGASVATIGTRSQTRGRGGGLRHAHRIGKEGGPVVDERRAPLSGAVTTRSLENNAIARRVLSLVVRRMALHPPLLLLGRSEGISDRPEEHSSGCGANVLELVLEILQQLPFALPKGGDVPLHRTVLLRQVQNRLGVLDRRANFPFVPHDARILHQPPDFALR